MRGRELSHSFHAKNKLGCSFPSIHPPPVACFLQQKRVINLSLFIAFILLIAKTYATAITGSAAIYSDAAESVVHLLAVGFAAWALRLAHKPADNTHHYGHDKISFISAGFEGAMISAAAFLIIYEASKQLIFGIEIRNLALGIWVTAAAAIINLILGLTLLNVGQKAKSPLLIANGKHVLTDVYTSAAVLIALLLIKLTGWLYWDPIIAIIAAINILVTGVRLIRDSLRGLLDEADPVVEETIRKLLDRETTSRNLTYHNFRHRHSGRSHWVEFHLLFPDHTPIDTAHDLATEIEAKVAALIEPDGRVITHLEPLSAEKHIESWEKP